ncbi:NADH dehydrogenase [Evansella vedderi]|uniref:NADH dehydrogenase n=1 Tax=Evansella vedderi TaxID=38282 RepID=A0ABT9ZPI4_9BACI|nr:NAD(P)/FAD-dependent oxidoreductase [Evansella vedderi]MDQ0253147.1 NADH dehydrogenase [Evansella vedderi]
MSKTRIVILGAGYGGMITSKRLGKLLKAGEADVTLINKHDYHYLTTELHKTAAGTEPDSKIALPITQFIDQEKVTFKKGTVSSIDYSGNKVLLEGGEKVNYDYLVVSLGFHVSTFGIPGIKEHAFEVRSFRSSKTIYHHIQRQFALYKEDEDPSRLTFVVAGAGFTGVEVVGELVVKLPELAEEYNIPFDKVRIVNVEAAPTILPGSADAAVDYASRILDKRGVEVKTSTKVLECKEDNIITDNGDLPSRTLIWTCGVQGHHLFEGTGIETVQGRAVVDEYLRIPTLKNVFCIGDNSYFKTGEKTPLPPTAQVALQQAPVCGDNIVGTIRGTELRKFEYHHKGSVASLSEHYGVGEVGGALLKGKIAAAMKKVIGYRYLFFLGGPSLMLKHFFGGGTSLAKVAAKQQG